MKPRPKPRYVVCETEAGITFHLRELAPGEEPYYDNDGHHYPPPKTLCDFGARWDTRIPLGNVTCRRCKELKKAHV